MEKPRTSQDLRDSFDRQSKWLESLGFFLRFITLVGVIASIFFIINGITETKRQSEINQAYIRCIVLLPAGSFRGTDQQRAKAIDDCAMKSKVSTTIGNVNPLSNATIATGALVISGLVLIVGLYLNSRRLKTMGVQLEDVHSEIKTANSMSIAQLADADESRRIDKIPVEEQTEEEKDHTRDMQ